MTNNSIDVDVIEGVDEAYYDYVGTKSKMDYKDGLMIDIGGGSTELVFVENNQIIDKCSIPIGSLNLYSKFVRDIIPNKDEIKLIKKETLNFLEKLDINKKNIETVCGIGGTIRALLKMKNILNKTVSEVITEDEFKKLTLYKTNTKEWMMNVLHIIPERIFTITVGTIILKTIMKYYNATSLVVSNYGVREGYLLEHIKRN